MGGSQEEIAGDRRLVEMQGVVLEHHFKPARVTASQYCHRDARMKSLHDFCELAER